MNTSGEKANKDATMRHGAVEVGHRHVCGPRKEGAACARLAPREIHAPAGALVHSSPRGVTIFVFLWLYFHLSLRPTGDDRRGLDRRGRSVPAPSSGRATSTPRGRCEI